MTEAVRRLVVELGHPNHQPTDAALEFVAAWCRQYQHDPADRVEELARVFDAGLREREQQLREARIALEDLHETLFIGSERGLSKESLGKMAKFAKRAALGEGAKG